MKRNALLFYGFWLFLIASALLLLALCFFRSNKMIESSPRLSNLAICSMPSSSQYFTSDFFGCQWLQWMHIFLGWWDCQHKLVSCCPVPFGYCVFNTSMSWSLHLCVLSKLTVVWQGLLPTALPYLLPPLHILTLMLPTWHLKSWNWHSTPWVTYSCWLLHILPMSNPSLPIAATCTRKLKFAWFLPCLECKVVTLVQVGFDLYAFQLFDCSCNVIEIHHDVLYCV